MKHNESKMHRRYAGSLRAYLQSGVDSALQSALNLGRQAVSLGVEPLEMARIHEASLKNLGYGDGPKAILERAERFFSEAIIPIVETHRTARQSKEDLQLINQSLRKRTAELASANEQLERGTERRKRMEAAVLKSGAHYARLLKDSIALQEGLRRLTHKVLTAQEAERKELSRELRDEIAQTLLGINVRLLVLKQETRSNTKGLKREISNTQRLVAKSTKSVQQLGLKLRHA